MEALEKHCCFRVLNSAGRCIADCQYNRESGYSQDCIGRVGNTSGNDGRKIQLGQCTGRKEEDND